ncbi:hypothetical protein [Absidia glauca]|uniref:Ndc10 domain-containing protein n=1 Tax=Absidia glauca TaxID=4829 RepID=A0A168RUR6_ABSGL|nr:hypothetical protein [Absidia glauca]
MKIKPPRQAQEWSYSSHRDRSARPSLLLTSGPTKRHISIAAHQLVWRVTCVRAWIKYDSKADGTTQRWRAYLTSLPREMMKSMAGFPTNGRSFYLARAVLNPPTSLCDHDVQEDFYTRLGAHGGTPPIWQHSIFSDPAYLSFKRYMLQIEA